MSVDDERGRGRSALVGHARVDVASARPAAWVMGLLLACVAPFALAAIPTSERAVLLNLHNQTAGPSWINRAGWGGAAGTECNWYGVFCDATQTHVIELELDGNNLSGTLPALAPLSKLMWINLFDNQLEGSLPALSGLAELRYFDVGRNQLSGAIPALAGLVKLEEFHAGENQLGGSIPVLASLAALKVFDVHRNQIAGNLPVLTGLVTLVLFDASGNDIAGQIPSLAGLNVLEAFRVDNNQLRGPVPSVPIPHNALVAGESALCPNLLDVAPSQPWNNATGVVPWYQDCPMIFHNGFEP